MLGCTVSYHGQHFAGWHRQQPGDASVQATLERAVSACLRGATAPMEDVRLNALTDVASAKGSHSRNQLCFFRATPEALALAAAGVECRPALELPTPGSLVAGPLRSLGADWPRPSRLHVRYFFQQGRPVRQLAPFAWYVREALDLPAMQRAAAVLEGTHDLSALGRGGGRRDGGASRPAETTIDRARVTLLPASAGAFDLLQNADGGSRPEGSACDDEDAPVSWLLQLEIVTAEGCGSLPRQLVQRLAALLRRVATPTAAAGSGAEASEALVSAAERAVAAVLDSSNSEAAELAVAPARGLWLEHVALQGDAGSARAAEASGGSTGAAVEPPAKRAHCMDSGDEAVSPVTGHWHGGDRAPVHTVSARALLASATGACWVGPTKPGSHRLRVSDYDRLLQLRSVVDSGASRPVVVVGVNSAALPQFFAKVWPRVHANVRCVILSADSDWGVPGELWAKSSQLRGMQQQQREQDSTATVLPSLRSVLEDPRLVSWFTQNYDFGFGCHLDLAQSCCCCSSDMYDVHGSNSRPALNSGDGDCGGSDTDVRALLDLGAAPLHKLRPLPIGLDFHSLSQKAVGGVIYRGMRATSAEHQQAELDAIAASLPPFIVRPMLAYGSRWRPLSAAAVAASPFQILTAAGQQTHGHANATGRRPSSGGNTATVDVENGAQRSISIHMNLDMGREGADHCDSTDSGDDDSCCRCPRAHASRVFRVAPYTGHIVIETEELHRSELWRRHGGFAFVISPPGHGLDCHRTWEALALGCIPITLAPTAAAAATTAANANANATSCQCPRPMSADANAAPDRKEGTSSIEASDADDNDLNDGGQWRNPLFSGLPVVVVQRWEDVTEQALHLWRAKHAASFDPSTPQGRELVNALRLQHWRTAVTAVTQ
jgi:tRNA U38,U39,U40 pseudouridine synthase TruA